MGSCHGRLKQWDPNFKASLGYTDSIKVKNNKQKSSNKLRSSGHDDLFSLEEKEWHSCRGPGLHVIHLHRLMATLQCFQLALLHRLGQGRIPAGEPGSVVSRVCRATLSDGTTADTGVFFPPCSAAPCNEMATHSPCGLKPQHGVAPSVKRDLWIFFSALFLDSLLVGINVDPGHHFLSPFSWSRHHSLYFRCLMSYWQGGGTLWCLCLQSSGTVQLLPALYRNAGLQVLVCLMAHSSHSNVHQERQPLSLCIPWFL